MFKYHYLSTILGFFKTYMKTTTMFVIFVNFINLYACKEIRHSYIKKYDLCSD